MAASIVVPARRSRDPRGIVARAAARSAPSGPGLAPVVALPSRGSIAAPVVDREPVRGERSALTLVPPVTRRRPFGARVMALAVATALLLGGMVVTVRGALSGSEEMAVAGHVVLQPGETLWDVAVRSAPVGVDPRRQLDTLRRLNGFAPGALDAWTVVLIPAP
jgi:hypothetical protein